MAYDLIVVGAGVLGTFHAYHAAKAGLRVLLLEKDRYPVGATVRNFGQVVPSGLAGRWFEHGRRSLEIYGDIQQETDLTIRQNGTVYVASDEAEWTLANELHDRYATVGYASKLLSKAQCLAKYPSLQPDYVRGAIFFPQEVSVEPDMMIHRLIAYCQQKLGVDYRSVSTVIGVDEIGTQGVRVTLSNAQQFAADRLLVCSGHEVRLLFPEVLAQADLVVSKLQMLKVAPVTGLDLPGNILTGLTIRRYEAFEECPSFASLATPEPLAELKKWGIHILFKQAIDGSIIVGDSHEYAAATEQEDLGFHTQDYINNLMLTEAQRIVQFPLVVQQAWAGFYSQTKAEIFEHIITENIRVTTGIGGKGMTSSAGYAEESIGQWYR
ncbi:TIGR03364 family FAD-dependent oxidoreductase [Spirosoma sp. KUDC1026]|uniref:TIGR03364 family FAD-dependent oxidoreductase n=1 Tax=Spirosoma sp. KUDC1026 TaxID=2745947 RepID=UPI00159BED6C|nr:TIGR03364 family FAD-dependent oxidoreductase [Spirosoma sp. KUDC1026]QKZ14714.1 TIGR03364 family FAD-dependent oxidoreductase [Spirosoma sp. KUDC1026]